MISLLTPGHWLWPPSRAGPPLGAWLMSLSALRSPHQQGCGQTECGVQLIQLYSCTVPGSWPAVHCTPPAARAAQPPSSRQPARPAAASHIQQHKKKQFTSLQQPARPPTTTTTTTLSQNTLKPGVVLTVCIVEPRPLVTI